MEHYGGRCRYDSGTFRVCDYNIRTIFAMPSTTRLVGKPRDIAKELWIGFCCVNPIIGDEADTCVLVRAMGHELQPLTLLPTRRMSSRMYHT